MTKEEIAMHITIKAIECGAIKFQIAGAQNGKTLKETADIANENNANSIANFFSTIYSQLNYKDQ